MHHINLKIFQRKYVFMDGELSLHVCSLYPHTKNIVFKDLLKVHRSLHTCAEQIHVSYSSLGYNIQNLTLTDLGSKGGH